MHTDPPETGEDIDNPWANEVVSLEVSQVHTQGAPLLPSQDDSQVVTLPTMPTPLGSGLGIPEYGTSSKSSEDEDDHPGLVETASIARDGDWSTFPNMDAYINNAYELAMPYANGLNVGDDM